MKKMTKRIFAIIMAVAMMAAVSVTAFAEGETASGALTADDKITVTGIDKGDKVTVYQIVKMENGDWAMNGTWKLTEGGNALTVADLKNISKEEAAVIAGNPGSPLDNANEVAVGDNGTFELAVDPGMYLVLVKDESNNTVYNPIFVSADYKAGGNSVDLPASNDGVAKKQDLDITKDINTPTSPDTDKKSVAPGDVIPFKVESNIPNYGENYTNPVYKITDTLSTGLSMTAEQQAAISVVVAGYPDIVKDTDYTVTPSASGYVVVFDKSFLYTVTGNPKVTITYEATVGSDVATHNVDDFKNEVELEFSNNPKDESDKGTRDDETHHYTFSIDANILGGTSGEDVTKELVKVGVDENGNVVEKWTTSDATSWSKVSPLAGATFQLTGGPNNITKTTQSGPNGEISFSGLDAGTYYLSETEAPAGYVKDNRTLTVVIDAQYATITDEADGSTTQILQSYSVTITDPNDNDFTATSSYTFSNDGENRITSVTQNAANETTPFVNKKGSELPSTGGIGTYVFTIAGVAIMAVAAGLLIVRRKKAE